MDNGNNLIEVKAAFKTICNMLDHDNWNYKKDEEKLKIECKAQGDDLPIDLYINVYPQIQMVMLLSPIPCAISEDKRLDLAIAVSNVNNTLVDGSFDYNMVNGKIAFRMTASFMGCELSESAVSYMIYCACHTIDAYNDKFLMLAKGLITIEQFLSDSKQ